MTAISHDPAVDRLRDRILDARGRRASLEIRGGATKEFYGEAPRGEPLDVGELTGISSYEPSELVITSERVCRAICSSRSSSSRK